MRSETIRLKSESGTIYEIRRKYEGDKVSGEEFLRDGKALDYAVYLSVDDVNLAYRQYKQLVAANKIRSERDLARLVGSWSAKRFSDKGGRVLYFVIDEEEKKARRGASKVICEYNVVGGQDVSRNGSEKKDVLIVAKRRSSGKKSEVPVVEPVEETPATEGQSIEDFLAGLRK
ncbi:hypothetical protein J4218_00005 [Candidatus Pacearchaeota archaeon]|nr:hypothetical protein [Candidatus Pacearchaeota archaeon]